jgi:uncharacterized protein YjbI with pentapeptide repeats
MNGLEDLAVKRVVQEPSLFKWIGRNRRLTGLAVFGLSLDRSFEVFTKTSSQIEALDLEGCVFSDVQLSFLGLLPLLKTLLLSRTNITDKCCRKLSQLQFDELDLSDTGITSRGVSLLLRKSSWNRLIFSGSGLSNAGLQNIRDQQKLEVLDISNTSVDDGAIEHLVSIHLISLVIKRTKISIAGIEKLLARSRIRQIHCTSPKDQSMRRRLYSLAAEHANRLYVWPGS